MARIRSIHPGLLTDEAFMALTVEAPALIPLLLGLWMEADDAGTFEWKMLSLKARILPALAVPVDGMMADLVARRFIKRFDFDGRAYGVVRNFVKFQRPKSPKDAHPASRESREFAGFLPNGKRPNATTGRKPFADDSELDPAEDVEGGNEFGTTSEPVPNSPGTSSGISAQMEDGGGRKKDSASLRSAAEPRVSADAEPAAPAPEKPIVEILFGSCLRYLVGNGIADKQARSVIGKWRRDYGDGEVAAAIGEAQKDAASDPISLVTAILLRRRDARARAGPGRTVPYSNASLARSLLQDIDHEHDSADPGRNGAALHRAEGHRERGSSSVIPASYLRLAGPDAADD